jgi:DNA-binding XRE family transcriptional regulator
MTEDITFKIKRSLDEFRYNLRLLRATTELSGVELSDKLGLASKRINDLEEGRTPPKMEDVISIATFFNITLSDLFARIELDIPSKRNKQ